MSNYGWAGQMLRVNLTNGSISRVPTAPYKEYVGGLGIGYKIIWDEVPLDTHPYAPEAKMVISTGPLTGSGVPCSGRTTLTFLTNYTKGFSICTGHMGGHLSQYIKYAGYDAIILEGKSPNPVYLRIDDGDVTLESAADLWGLDTMETNKRIIDANGPEFTSMSIGPAGENLVNYSIVFTSQCNAAGGGCGAVLGSKNLKAIAARGTGYIQVADPQRVMELSHYQLTELIGGNNNHPLPTHPQSWSEYTSQPPNRWRGAPGLKWERAPGGPVDTGEQPYWELDRIAYRMFKGVQEFGEARNPMQYTVGQGGCASCPTRCYNRYDFYPLEELGETPKHTNTCGGTNFSAANIYAGNAPDIAEEGDSPMLIGGIVSRTADRLGVWNNYSLFQREFRWCYERGVFERVLSEEEYNEIPWEWLEEGDIRWGKWFLEAVAYKRGDFGRVLGEGTWHMAMEWGLDNDEFWDDPFLNMVNRLGYPQHHSANQVWQSGMIYNPLYNRDCMVHAGSSATRNGLPFEHIKNVIDGWFGEGATDPPLNFTPINDAKVKFGKWALLRKQWHDTATLCDWMWPMTFSPSRNRGYSGDIDLDAKFMTAVTGDNWTTDDVDFIAEKTCHMLRVMTAISFKIHHGLTNMRVDHDHFVNHWFDRDPDMEPFTEGTFKMCREDLALTMTMFYESMGWDTETAIPTRATLERFGLGDMADALEEHDLLPG